MLLGMLGLMLVELSSSPPLSWDEGWTLTVARNWLERGYYGRYLAGEPTSPALAAAFPSVASVAASFKLFGVGVWQGRLPAACYILGALVCLYVLARQLYTEAVARTTLLVAVLMAAHLSVQPLYMGRQVLAEPIMLFFLLLGYVALWASFRQPRWAIAMMLAWGIGLTTKSQPLPFWLVSLLLPLLVSLITRRWRVAALLTSGLLGALLAARLLVLGQDLLLAGRTQPIEPLQGLYQVTALVTAWGPRMFALNATLVVGLPTLLALLHAGRQWLITPGVQASTSDVQLMRMTLWAFSGSWFAWYVLLSVGWVRYLFPAMFVGNIFVAALISDWTHGYHFDRTMIASAQALRGLINNRRISRQGVQTVLAFTTVLALTLTMVIVSIKQFTRTFTDYNNPAAVQVMNYLNTNTPPNAMIESYDSEIFFLLDRPYHYPPDQTNVEMILRGDLNEEVPSPYQPLIANPDYLVVGVFSRAAEVYDEVLKTNAFREVKQYRGYTIYERVR